jgi:hypothetical protein
MRRLAVFAVAASLVGTVAAPAWAAGDCPDGDWFCDPAPVPDQGPAGPGPAPAPPSEAPPRGVRRRELPPPPPPGLPPPYAEPYPEEDDGQIRIDVPRIEPVHRRRRRGYHEWGLNMHAAIGLMGNDTAMSPDAGMNGFGAALRLRPIPYVAIEGSVELMFGTDYNGFQRFEDALLINGLFYANPFSAVQVYGIAGFGLANAYLNSGLTPDGQPVLRDETYSYLGAQLGVGVEGRVTRHFALGADLIGFLRWRDDPHASRNPEFIDPATHRTTNRSGGGLLRLGATFYW